MRIVASMSKVSASRFIWLLCILLAPLSQGNAVAGSTEGQAVNLPLHQAWSGDYPLAALELLPHELRRSPAGFIGDEALFRRVWQAFRPATATPMVDFERQFVVFQRNVRHYGHTAISRVLMQNGVVEIVAPPEATSIPVVDKVAMFLAVIPRDGVTAVQVDASAMPVGAPPGDPAADPLDASYRLEGAAVRLKAGRAEEAVAAGAASKVSTSVSGEPVQGDLEGDQDEDVALVLVNSGGGSGSFYYVAVARNVQGAYQGSNAIWLGDRIIVRDIAIRNGLLIVRYLDRNPYEPMTTPPGLEKTMPLHFSNGRLNVLARLGDSEELLEGRVVIGHEVRSFVPCGQDVEHWLDGGSPAIGEIMTGYREKLPDEGAYAPLFAVMAGHRSAAPTEGFGADYPAAIVATRLIRLLPDGRCPGESVPQVGRK